MRCLYCDAEIPEPKKGQKFCHKRCRYAFNNRLKTYGFVGELIALFIKYKVVELKSFEEAFRKAGYELRQLSGDERE